MSDSYRSHEHPRTGYIAGKHRNRVERESVAPKSVTCDRVQNNSLHYLPLLTSQPSTLPISRQLNMTSVADKSNKHRNLSNDFPFVGRKIHLKVHHPSERHKPPTNPTNKIFQTVAIRMSIRSDQIAWWYSDGLGPLSAGLDYSSRQADGLTVIRTQYATLATQSSSPTEDRDSTTRRKQITCRPIRFLDTSS
jgi:hypothetical protein